ncbi:Na+/H+ antiporter NhaA [Nocardioides humilatus]|uniref:Na(+)/H(+) antiporter NhaA n=1 Tax=Nocardioides humilatus TaxID=2607660 RepID=A0A5B1LKY6_9ACTN|nr:Na+/H+ antiporter NhaA [Nocardioides humilatus]KAA1420279.1 Na+/H+ antiporter NhaA [Nocardioides humilatus]
MTSFLRRFLQVESASSVVLLAAAAAALVWANVSMASYGDFWHPHLQHWVNDGLMVVFFFVVGLEIKYELVEGDLRDPRTAALPVVAAIGGMVVPALLYLAVAGRDAAAGWGIPMATDIAFAVGVLGLLGSRLPSAARLFLLTLAIVDDIGAIVVIAVFYTDDLALGWLAAAVGGLLVVVGLRVAGVRWWLPYLAVGVLVWLALLQSGVHATLAGVALGLLTPAATAAGLQQRVHPLSAYVVLPVFALANAGVALGSGVLDGDGSAAVALGVGAGLVLGKPLGILLACFVAVRVRLARLPDGVGWAQLTGIGAVAGIGFTVSLFIAGLSFPDAPALTEAAKVGVLAGSVLAAAAGLALLARVSPRQPPC